MKQNCTSQRSLSLFFPIKPNVLPFDIHRELCYALQAKVSPVLQLNFVRAREEIQEAWYFPQV